MQTTTCLIAPETTQTPTFEAVLARNIADAERDLANGRVQWERARRRVVALEAVVDHWRFVGLELRTSRDRSRRCVSA